MRRFRVEGGVVDLSRRFVERDGRRTRLTGLDVRLLAYLVERSPRPVARSELLREVWNYGPGVRTEAVEQAVRRLRTKLEPTPSRPVTLLTDRGHGYRLVTLAGDTPRPAGVPSLREPSVGRVHALDTLRSWLDDGHRLVTVVGIGGIGKTRIASETLGRWSEANPCCGAWFVDLTSAWSLADVVTSVTNALGVPVRADALGGALAELGKVLVVLDNVEQILEPVASLVSGWLRVAPELRVVCTSREPLRELGEQVLELGPLETDAAVELWRRRTAGRATASEGHDEVVRAITDRLDRIPLAIELAAARSGGLAPGDLLATLDTAPSREVRASDPRHVSMQACLGWSWNLLTPAQREVFRQCVVFRGGWSRAAVREVLKGELDTVLQLVDRSMIRATQTVDADTRYDLLAVVRQFLEARPDLHDARDRHAVYYARMGEETSLQERHRDPSAARRAALEVANLHAALQHALSRDDGRLVASCVAALTSHRVNQPEIGLRDLEPAIDRPQDGTRERAEVALSRSRLLVALHRLDEAEWVVRRALALPDVPSEQRPRLLIRLASAYCVGMRFDECWGVAERVLAEASGPHARWHRAAALNYLGEISMRRKRLDDARHYFHEELLINEEVGRNSALGEVRRGLGSIAFAEGDLAGSRAHFEAALVVERAFGSLPGELHTLWRLSTVLVEQEELEASLEATKRALDIAKRLGNAQLLGYAHYGVGSRLLRTGRTSEAREHLHRARERARRHDNPHLGAMVDAVFEPDDAPATSVSRETRLTTRQRSGFVMG